MISPKVSESERESALPHNRSSAMGPKPDFGQSLKALPAASLQDWSTLSDDERQDYLGQIQALYLAVLEEFFQEANLCVGIVRSSHDYHRRWRLGLITATGFLAILNLLAAYVSHTQEPIDNSLSLVAAVYAAGLAIATNLDSFFNYSARAQVYRESREMFLDAYREFEMLWNVRIRPFGFRPEACVNASEAYRLLIERDRELRSKVKELTATKKPESPK